MHCSALKISFAPSDVCDIVWFQPTITGDGKASSRTAVFLALYAGGKNSPLIQRELGILLTKESAARGVIPVMVSAKEYSMRQPEAARRVCAF